MPPRSHLKAQNSQVSLEDQGSLLQIAHETGYDGHNPVTITPEVGFPQAAAPVPDFQPTTRAAESGFDTNAEMITALNAIGRAGMQHALTQAPNRKLRQSYSQGEIEDRKETAEYYASAYEKNAEAALRRALGAKRPAPDAQLSIEEVALEATFQRKWAEFRTNYSGPENKNARRRFMNRLKRAGEPVVSRLVVLDQASIPSDTETIVESDPDAPISVYLPTLTTTEKLDAVMGDERASFMPVMSQEKNDAQELLDYLDPQQYRGGVHERLIQIYDRQLKNGRALKVRDPVIEGEKPPQPRRLSMAETIAQAKDAVRSKLYTYGDYLMNAQAEFNNLSVLYAAIIDEPNPAISLSEVLTEPEYEGIDPRSFVRYMDLKYYHDLTPEQQGRRRTMVTLEDRSNPTEEKHKTVEDRYTAADMPLVVQIYVESRLKELTVGDVRKNIVEATEDQYNREAFWRMVLGDVRYTYRPLAQRVLSQAPAEA
jgi:hypothetical protein